MLVVAFVSFSLFNFVGDPINNMVGEETSDEERAELRETLGLMDPIHVQFSRFVVNASKGEFGMSWIIVSVYYYGETTIAMSSIIYILLTVILTLIFTSPLLILKSALSFTKINNNFFSVLFIFLKYFIPIFNCNFINLFSYN